MDIRKRLSPKTSLFGIPRKSILAKFLMRNHSQKFIQAKFEKFQIFDLVKVHAITVLLILPSSQVLLFGNLSFGTMTTKKIISLATNGFCVFVFFSLFLSFSVIKPLYWVIKESHATECFLISVIFISIFF